MANEQQLVKNFEQFEKDVRKLQELGQELSKIHAKGFEAETSLIRTKLKDTSAIPFIEKHIELLRKKIVEQQKTRQTTALAPHSKEIDEHAEHALNANISISAPKTGQNLFTGLLSKEAEAVLNAEVNKRMAQLTENTNKQLILEKNKLQKQQKQRLAELENQLKTQYESKTNKTLRAKEEILAKNFEDKVNAQKNALQEEFAKRKNILETKYFNLQKQHHATLHETNLQKQEFEQQLKKDFDAKLNLKIMELNQKHSEILARMKSKELELCNLEAEKKKLAQGLEEQKTELQNKSNLLTIQKNKEIKEAKKQLCEEFEQLAAQKLREKVNNEFCAQIRQKEQELKTILLKKYEEEFATKQKQFEQKTRRTLADESARELEQQKKANAEFLAGEKEKLQEKCARELARQKSVVLKQTASLLHEQKLALFKRLEVRNALSIKQKTLELEQDKNKELQKFKTELQNKQEQASTNNKKIFEQQKQELQKDCEQKTTKLVIERCKELDKEFAGRISTEKEALLAKNAHYLASKTKEIEDKKVALENNFANLIKTELRNKVQREFNAMLDAEKNKMTAEISQKLENEKNVQLKILQSKLASEMQEQNKKELGLERKKLEQKAQATLLEQKRALQQEYARKEKAMLEEKKEMLKKELTNSLKKIF